MVLIVSQENDPSTDNVIQWLLYFKKEYFRINDTDSIEIQNFELSDQGINYTLKTLNGTISFSEITSFWYRRGDINLMKPYAPIDNFSNVSLKFFLKKEIETVKEFIYYTLFNEKKSLGYYPSTINKLYVLNHAQTVGLRIPHSYIVNRSAGLNKITKRHGSVISKSIFESIHVAISESNCEINNCTTQIDKKKRNTPEHFLYTLLQREVKKDFELRIFFIKDSFYAAAMLTQANPKTRIDFRNYDNHKPTRILPFRLPREIKTKLIRLNKLLALDTGSIDMICNGGEYYFLEVNPSGQFGMIGLPCNYNLEKKIAKYLSLK